MRVQPIFRRILNPDDKALNGKKGGRQKLHCLQNENQKEIVGQSKGQQIFF